MINFTGERIVPEADNCEPRFAQKMYQEHIARYAFSSQWVRDKQVLDVGCGVGYGAHWLAENGAKSVLAFDIAPDAIEHARELYSHPKVSYEVASAVNFDFGKRFDVVTCFELIEHVAEQQAVIKCIRQALTDDGVLIISTPRALEVKRTHFHERELTISEFMDLLKDAFPQLSLYFENNHFSSLITDHKPTQLDFVLPLYDQYTIAQADYFIAVASPSSSDAIVKEALPTIVVGDDKYVTLLERDVGILHKAENRLIELVNNQQAEIETLRQTNLTLSLEESGNVMEMEIERLQSLVDQKERLITQLQSEIAENNARQLLLNDEMNKAEAQIDLIKDVLQKELGL